MQGVEYSKTYSPCSYGTESKRTKHLKNNQGDKGIYELSLVLWKKTRTLT